MKKNTELSERLRQLRKNAGLSQEQLAEALDISRQAVSKWESGVSNPDIQNIIQLGKLYGISTDAILLGVSPASENTSAADITPEAASITPQNAALTQKTTVAAPQKEEPSVGDSFPVSGFFWAFLGTLIVLVFYFITNVF